MENSNPKFSGNEEIQSTGGQNQKFGPEPRKSWVSEYYEAVKAGMWRVWFNRYLWFWGIFLPVGWGMNFNYNFTERQDLESQESLKESFYQLQSFVSENMAWLVLAVLAFLALGVLFWVVSAIARSGVFKALNQLQNPAEPKTFNFKQVWGQGRENFAQILVVDLFIGVSMLIIILALSGPILALVFRQQYAFAAILGILAMLIYLPILVLSYFLRTVGSIFCALSRMKALKALELAYDYVRIDLRETLKMLLALLGLGLFRNIVFVAMVIFLVFAGGLVGLFFSFIFGFDAVFGGENKTLVLILIGVLAFVIFLAALFLQALFSLWFSDLWVWWTSKVGGLKSKIARQIEEKAKKPVEEKVLSGAE